MQTAKKSRVAYYFAEGIGLHASMEAALLKPHIIRSVAPSRAPSPRMARRATLRRRGPRAPMPAAERLATPY